LDQDLFNSIVEISPNFVAVIQNEKFVYVNSTGHSLLNCSNPNDIIGRCIYEFFHSDTHGAIKNRWVIAEIYNQATDPLNIELITTKGDSVYLETSQTPFIYKKNKALLLIGRNITNVQSTRDSSFLKQKVLFREKIIKKFAENSPMGILLSRGKIPIFINKSFLKLLGLCSMEDFLKMKHYDFIHPDDRNSLEKLLKKIFDVDVDEPVFYQLTARSFGQQGILKVLDLRFLVFRSVSKVYLQVMAIDITDEIEKEKMVYQLASDSLRTNQNNVVISDIKKELETALQDKNNNYSTKNQFYSIQKLLEELPKYENEWGLFNKRFEHLHPGFISNLKIICPMLTVHEIKHCACIRLDINTKEIAMFFNVTPATIQKSRVRLKKKLDLPEYVDLREFIENV